jgi:hypothetical protein
MKQARILLFLILLLTICMDSLPAGPAKEFLTEEEVELIQIKQEIDPRIKSYLAAALLRLESAEARMLGEETLPGDPLEYFTPEDMLDGYYKILNSVMVNLDDANQKATRDSNGLRKALKELRKRSKEALKRLEYLEKLAKEQDKKEMVQLIQRAVEITQGAQEGADYALSEKTYTPNKGQ